MAVGPGQRPAFDPAVVGQILGQRQRFATGDVGRDDAKSLELLEIGVMPREPQIVEGDVIVIGQRSTIRAVAGVHRP